MPPDRNKDNPRRAGAAAKKVHEAKSAAKRTRELEEAAEAEENRQKNLTPLWKDRLQTCRRRTGKKISPGEAQLVRTHYYTDLLKGLEEGCARAAIYNSLGVATGTVQRIVSTYGYRLFRGWRRSHWFGQE